MEFVLAPSLESVAFWSVTILWGAEFLVFRSHRYGERREGELTYALIFAAVLVTFALTGLLYHLRAGNLGGSLKDFVRRGSLTLYASGIALRCWAAWSLGSWFSRRVEARRGQILVSVGPYRFLRHPLYLGLFLLGIGLNGLMANPVGMAVAVVCLGLVLNLRMVEEERILESTIGSRYREWKSKRYRFVPFVY